MKFHTRKIVMPVDLNDAASRHGTLFGGRALSWIDEEAAIFVNCQLSQSPMSFAAPRAVTKAMSAVNFRAPAHCGDIVEIGTQLIRFGTTSITVKCTLRNKTTKSEIVTVDEIVFVTVDHAGKPIPHGLTKELKDDN